jgi:lia operon protein LiaG
VKTRNTFFKSFIFLTLFTGICWILSYGFASLAGEKPYPQSLFSQLEKRLNSDLKETHESKSWPDQDIKKIDISVDSADIELVPHSSNEFKANLDGFIQADQPLSVTAQGNVLTIKVEGKRQTRWKFLSGPNIEATNSLRLKVFVPKNFNNDLKIDTGSGDIKLADLTLADLNMNAGSGDINIDKVTAVNLDAETGSGDLELSGHIKATMAKTGSGDISVKALEGERLTLSTGSGEILLDTISSSSVRAETGSGDVTAKVGQIEKWTASAKTGSGDIESDFPGGQRSSHPDELKVGTGQNQLDIETGSGDIFLKL